MSIDREVNSVANAYMGNETALQNKYAVEKQLIDLLALQKLKSDREAAAKEMQMKAQVPPATVAGQLENENLEVIKQQIVGGMPQEGILAAAQGGMVRRFAEGGEVDLNGAEQNLPFDATVDADLDEARQTLPSDATVEVDPEKMEELLDSSSEDEKIQKEIERKVQRKAIGPIVRGGFVPNRVLEGSPAYRQLEENVREEVYGEAVDDLLGKKIDPKTVQSDEDYNKALALKVLRDKGQISAEQLYEVVKSGQLPKPKVATGATGTGATGTGATTEPRKSAYDKIMEKYDANYEDQIANLNADDRIKRKEDRLAKLAEISKPEERSLVDKARDFFAGAAASGVGGGGDALRQAELVRRKRKKEYQTMLVENEDQIDTLAQTLGDKEMAIKLTAATNEYARDVQAKALAIDNARDRRDFILRSVKEMGENIETAIIENPFYQAKLYQEGPEAAKKFASNLRETLMQSPSYKIINKMLAEMGVSLTGSSSGASSSGLTSGSTQYIPNQK